MKLVRSDSPEVAPYVASTAAVACWGWSVLALACIATVIGLLIVLAASLISVRAAAWLAVPVVLALNGYVLWWGTSPRLNWVVVGHDDRVFVKPFLRRRRGRADLQGPDVITLEAQEIASMSARTVEVFLDGPKPRIVQWLVIEPSEAVAENVSDRIHSLLSDRVRDPGKQAIVAIEGGCLTMKWEWCHPALPVFLEQVAREYPSLLIAPENRSELDLNGIWRGISRNLRSDLGAQDRQKLVQAKRLGFGCNCAGLLSRYKNISFRKAGAYLAEIEREDAGAR
ncbi:MAG: hypothetical protein WBC78_09295 [Candidatus Sulfotelmatobacter sp.]